MTGIERLEGISMAFRGYTWGASLSEALSDIAGQIKREHAEDCFRMGERAADVSMSVYDLLPEEEREAIAWVREHGGLGAVRKMAAITLDVYQRLVDDNAGLEMLETDADTIDSMMAEIDEAIVKRCKERMAAQNLLEESVPRVTYERHIIKRQRQIDESHAALRRRNERIAELEHERDDLREMVRQLNASTDEMEKHLMPEGMEWPRFEDGEPVRFGDVVSDGDETGRVYYVTLDTVNPVIIGFTDETPDQDPGSYLEVSVSDGERVKRPAPKVLDADGVEIRVGDEVFVIENGKAHHVTEIDATSRRFKSMEQMGDDATWLDPMCFTHRAPVLAADGLPLREGETVWHRSGFAHGVVESIDAGSLMHTVRYRGEDGSEYRDAAKDLTHDRPDSWQALFDWVRRPGMTSNADFPEFERRARALAGGA